MNTSSFAERRFGATGMFWCITSKKKKKNRRIYCIDCVCSSFRKHMHKTHKIITTATKNPNGVQPVCIANDLPPLLLPSGLVGEEMWSINQPWGWFNWLSSSLCLVQKLLFTPAKSLIGWIEILPESAGPTCDNTSSSALMEMFELFGPCRTTKLTVGRNNSAWT